MERVIDLECIRSSNARLKLTLTLAGTMIRTQELQRGDKPRWVYTSKAYPIALPEDDEEVRCGPILLRCCGIQVDVLLDDRQLGRCSLLSLAMYVEEIEKHRRRMEDPLPAPGRP